MLGSVPRETLDTLEHLEQLVIAESKRQNLVAPSTFENFRQRHVEDSLQLLDLLPPGPLLDIGSGAGFPGLALACCRLGVHHLVEPRKKRAVFLREAAQGLGLAGRVIVHQARVETLALPPVAVITARAVSSLANLFQMACHLADRRTRWVLLKGQTAAIELAEARKLWQGEFTLSPSVTQPDASIVLASDIRRR